MFDTHAHLNFKDFDGRIPEILERCRRVGVKNIMIPGTGIDMSRKAIELADAYENLYASVGIHPADIVEAPKEALEDVAEEALGETSDTKIQTLTQLIPQSTKIRAIGEIGLDRYFIYRKMGKFDEALFQKQIHIFTAQFRLAKDLHKAVIIHNRESKKDLIRILEDNWDAYYANKVVIHCCEPDEQLLEFAIAHDIFIGVDGDVTYSEEKQIFMHKVPLDRLVIETDSPFLTPSPPRDDKAAKYPNSPEHLPLIAQKIASIKGIDIVEVDRETTQNAKTLFGL